MSIFSDRLLQARQNANLSQKKLAEMLEITPTRLNYWEKGKREPDVEMIKKISQVLNINPNHLIGLDIPNNANYSLTLEEKHFFDKYKELDQHGKEIIKATLDIELKRIEEEKQKALYVEEYKQDTIMLPYPELPASAGTGEYLDAYGYRELIEVPRNELTEHADMVIRVNGDSMEPLYFEGDKLLISFQPDVDFGNIGIFVINNERYVKKKTERGLASLNKKYPDIVINEFDEVACVGKVIGKL